MTALIDYGAGNTTSVGHALDRLGAAWALTADMAVLDAADRVILPGVGAAGTAMRALAERGLVEWLRTSNKPLLGICLGLQLLYERSEEDAAEGLGRLPGVVRRLPEGPEPTPHMGWNTLHLATATSLLDLADEGAFVYYAHSYAAPVGPETRATTRYAGTTFGAVVERGPVLGVQFHPEKSAAVGAAVLRRFLAR